MHIINKPKLLYKSKIFFSYINHIFYNSKIMISKLSLKIFNKTIFLFIHVYFLASLKGNKKKINCNLLLSRINIFFKNQFELFKINSIVLKIVNLNKFVTRRSVKNFFFKFKKFKMMLFSRNNNLFINFINLTFLIVIKKINIKCYVILITKIFVHLKKRIHSKFMLFIKFLINWFISNQLKYSKVIGIKFSISGRLKGKPRGDCFKILKGSMPCQKILSNIKFTQIHAYNRYGAFGIKLWFNYY